MISSFKGRPLCFRVATGAGEPRAVGPSHATLWGEPAGEQHGLLFKLMLDR